MPTTIPSPSPVDAWLAARGWDAFDFQRQVWEAIAQGRSGLLHATTGSGKTYAVWLGMLAEIMRRHPPARHAEPLRLIWLTPMRALASDTTRALAAALRELAPAWTIARRTGRIEKNLVVDTLIPPDPGKYSWAGHLGARMH